MNREAGNRAEYRVMSKSAAFVLIAVLASIGGGATWLTIGWIESRSRELLDAPDWMLDSLQSQIAAHVTTLAWLLAGPVIALAAYIAWYGYRGIVSRSLPPTGSWIIEGQQVRRGPGAVKASILLIALSVVMALIAAMLFVLVRRIALKV